MAKETRSDSGHAEQKDRVERVVAAEKKTAAKKVTKKKKSKAKTKKKSAARKSESSNKAAPAAAAPPASPAPGVHAASVPAPHESSASSPMRGIVALWGPLAIIVLLIVVARIGDDEPLDGSRGATAVLPASLETAAGVGRDVVEDVRDALTGGDPQAAAALGAGSGAGRSSREDLAAAFQDAGAAGATGGVQSASAPKSTVIPDPWDASSQSTVPAGMAARPEAAAPYPENPWAPVDPMAAPELSDPYQQGAPPPPGPPPGRGYGRAEGHMPGGMYMAPDPYYPQDPRGQYPRGQDPRGQYRGDQYRRGYGPPPGYGEGGPGYPRQHAYGGMPGGMQGGMQGGMPGYGGPPPGYGEPQQGNPYAQPYYGEPAPYPQDYYPPAQ